MSSKIEKFHNLSSQCQSVTSFFLSTSSNAVNTTKSPKIIQTIVFEGVAVVKAYCHSSWQSCKNTKTWMNDHMAVSYTHLDVYKRQL